MKKKLLLFCYYINIFILLGFIIIVLAMLFKMNYILNFSTNDTFILVRTILTIPVIILWVNNLIIWAKKDKNVGRFFLLFFLNGLYNPLYFNRIEKNGWQ